MAANGNAVDFGGVIDIVLIGIGPEGVGSQAVFGEVIQSIPVGIGALAAVAALQGCILIVKEIFRRDGRVGRRICRYTQKLCQIRGGGSLLDFVSVGGRKWLKQGGGQHQPDNR